MNVCQVIIILTDINKNTRPSRLLNSLPHKNLERASNPRDKISGIINQYSEDNTLLEICFFLLLESPPWGYKIFSGSQTHVFRVKTRTSKGTWTKCSNLLFLISSTIRLRSPLYTYNPCTYFLRCLSIFLLWVSFWSLKRGETSGFWRIGSIGWVLKTSARSHYLIWAGGMSSSYKPARGWNWISAETLYAI